MRKGLLALENLDTAVPLELEEGDVPDEGEVAVIEQTVDTNEEQLAAQADQISEAEDIGETLNGINDALAPEVAEGAEGLDNNEAAALAVATEFFQRRLDYRGDRVFPAFENFQNDRKAATRLAIEHNKMLKRATDRGLVLAQEGFLAKLANSVDFLFTSNNKLRRLNQEVSRKYDQGQVKTQPISDPGWGRFLNPDSKLEMTGQDVLARLKSFQVRDLQAVQDKVTKIVAFIRQAGGVVNESWFMANKEQLARMNEYSNQMAQEVDQLRQMYQYYPRTGDDASFQPADKSIKGQLVQEIDRTLQAQDLKQLVDTYEQAWEQVGDLLNNQQLRLGGAFAADIKLLRGMFQKSGDALDAIYDAYNFRHRLGHSAIKYLAASAG